MLFRLPHPAVISRDDKEREINRADARDHVPDEILMAGNVDDACVNRLAIRRGQIQFGETELNRDFPRFFFRQAVRISSGQRFYECALAVIDVARRGDDEMLFCHRRNSGILPDSSNRLPACTRVRAGCPHDSTGRDACVTLRHTHRESH